MGQDSSVETGLASAEEVEAFVGKEAGEVVLSKQVYALRQDVIRLRRKLHANPELSGAEKQTNKTIVEYLRALESSTEYGLHIISEKCGGYGVVAVIQGRGDGPCVLLRADLDALPITEKTGLSFASATDGLMHACGHDCHTAIALVTAKILSQLVEHMHGSVKMVFQAAEEIMTGAIAMINEGVLESPAVDVTYALHMRSTLDLGKVKCSPCEMLAGCGQFIATVRGGNSIVAAAYLVTQLHSIVDRDVDAMDTGVLTIGTFHGSEECVELEGTFRFFDTRIRDLIKRRISEVCSGVEITQSVGIGLEFCGELLPVINTEPEFENVRKVCAAVIPKGFIEQRKVAMGSEDFSEFLKRKPGAFFLLGCKDPSDSTVHAHHQSTFFVDERSLPVGVQLMCSLALNHLTAA